MTQFLRKMTLAHRGFFREVALVVVAYMLYSLVRVSISEQVVNSFARAISLMDIERRLGFFWELHIQSWVVSRPVLMEIFNQVYLWSYMPAIGTAAIWLYFRRPEKYPFFRNAFLASGGIALLFFWLVPTAPPRFFPWLGFEDTLFAMRSAYRSVTVDSFVNNYAAFPSMHFGWIFLLGIALVTVGGNRAARVAGVLLPVLMLITVIATGNHFILDAAAGALVALAGLGTALLLNKHGDAIRRGVRNTLLGAPATVQRRSAPKSAPSRVKP